LIEDVSQSVRFYPTELTHRKSIDRCMLHQICPRKA
jgi:hypothetical protein